MAVVQSVALRDSLMAQMYWFADVLEVPLITSFPPELGSLLNCCVFLFYSGIFYEVSCRIVNGDSGDLPRTTALLHYITMIYELSVYWAELGKLEALHNRFRNVTLALFARHQMQVIAFWTPSPAGNPDTGDLVYLLAFPDEAALAKSWEAFRADPDWQAGRAASEVNGKLVAKATRTVLHPTDYSPLK